MAVKPILFSGSMVRAILDGRKTMTRRVLKLRKGITIRDLERDGERETHPLGTAYRATRDQVAEPRFAPGDLLWVREGLGRRTASFLGIEATNGTEEAFYLADDEDVVEQKGFNVLPWWKGSSLPSIHMPRWASRLTLAVTAVKVERLQDISEADAEAEGLWRGKARRHLFWQNATACRLLDGASHKAVFADLWNSINSAGAWEANPWVAAVSFTVHRANVDAMPAEAA